MNGRKRRGEGAPADQQTSSTNPKIVNGTDFNWRNVMPGASQMKPWSSLCGCLGGLGFTLMTHAKQTLDILAWSCQAGTRKSVVAWSCVINIKPGPYYNWYHHIIRETFSHPVTEPHWLVTGCPHLQVSNLHHETGQTPHIALDACLSLEESIITICRVFTNAPWLDICRNILLR